MARGTSMHRYVYQVTGQGRNFPIDMLRYDGSSPEHSTDATSITDTFTDPTAALVTVTLSRWAERGWQPEAARWRSFHWSVVFGSLKAVS